MTSDMKPCDAKAEDQALFTGFLEQYFYEDFRTPGGQHQVE